MSSLAVDFPTTVLLLGAVYGIIFSLVVIVSNPSPARPKFWLGIFVGAFASVLLDNWGISVGLEEVFLPFGYAYYRCITIIPLSLWLYVQGLTGGGIRISWPERAASVLIGFELLVIVSGIISRGAISDTFFWTTPLFFDSLGILLAILFLYKSVRRTQAYAQQVANNYAYLHRQSLQWLRQLLVMLGILMGLWVIIIPINAYSDTIYISFMWLWLPMAFVVFFIGIRGYLMPSMIHDFEMVPASSFDNSVSRLPISNATTDASFLEEQAHHADNSTPGPQVSRDDSLQHHRPPATAQPDNKDRAVLQVLIDSMENHKLYRSPKLSVKDVADHLRLSPRYVSSLINQHFHVTFSDFVNRYRVEKVKQRIETDDSETYTLLAIGLDAGFNSKTAFYQAFRQFTQMTPAQYREKRLV